MGYLKEPEQLECELCGHRQQGEVCYVYIGGRSSVADSPRCIDSDACHRRRYQNTKALIERGMKEVMG